MMKKSMIIGIGVGSTVEYSIYSSMKMNNPNFIAFIVTSKSKSTLDRMISGKRLRDLCQYEEFTINDPEDMDDTYSTCEKAVESLLKKGYSSSDIVVDITSGTKIMSAAISSLAVLYRLY